MKNNKIFEIICIFDTIICMIIFMLTAILFIFAELYGYHYYEKVLGNAAMISLILFGCFNHLYLKMMKGKK